MLNKKIIRDILLDVEAGCYGNEKYLQEVVDIVLNNNNGDIKYIIARAGNYNSLYLYKYSESNYIAWLYNHFYIDDADVNDLVSNYEIILEYAKKEYINYYVENNILNFISIKKFRKELSKN